MAVSGDEGNVPVEVDPREMRVSDAEREHVAGVLQKAVGRGLITLDEFSERTDVALAAKTRGQLNAVLVDIVDLRHAERAPAVSEQEQPLLLRTRTGNVKQHGHWVVPRAIDVECGMGNVSVDFTQAECAHREVVLRATTRSGNVTVIVPRGWTVRMEEATSGMGSVVNKATDTPNPELPVLRVFGKAGMGHVKIRHPRGRR
jgi:hypothetical protein